MRRRIAGAVAVAAVLVSACGATSTDSDAGAGPDSLSPVPSAATSVPEPQEVPLPDLETLRSTTVTVSGAPAALVESPGSLWVQQHRGFDLTRLDAELGTVLGSVNTGLLGCGDLTWAAGAVWLTGCAVTPGLLRVDGETTELTHTLDLSGLGAAYEANGIWATNLVNGRSELRRIDVANIDDGRVVPVPGLGADEGVAAVGGSIWVSESRAALVHQIDAASEEVIAVIPMPVPPSNTAAVAAHDGAAWYIDPRVGVLIRIDPVDGSTRLLNVRTEKPSEYWGFAASTALGDPGRLWVRSGDAEVWLVDTRQDQVLRRIAVVDGGGGDVQQIGGSLWVASFATNQVQRIQLQPS